MPEKHQNSYEWSLLVAGESHTDPIEKSVGIQSIQHDQ